MVKTQNFHNSSNPLLHEKHGLHAGKMSNNAKVKVKYAFLKFTDNKSQSNGRCLDSRKPYTLFFPKASQNLNVVLVLLMKRLRHVPFRDSKFTRIPWGKMQRRNSLIWKIEHIETPWPSKGHLSPPVWLLWLLLQSKDWHSGASTKNKSLFVRW